jgi:ribosomal protein L14
MIKMNSFVNCVDNTGVADVKIIQVFGNKNKREALYGDRVFIVVKSWDRSSKSLTDEKQRKKFRKGSMHRGIIVHLKIKVKRLDST